MLVENSFVSEASGMIFYIGPYRLRPMVNRSNLVLSLKVMFVKQSSGGLKLTKRNFMERSNRQHLYGYPFQPPHKKTNNQQMRKQRRRSASQYNASTFLIQNF